MADKNEDGNPSNMKNNSITENPPQMTVEPVKKKKLFASLGKALRKKPKSKAKSMNDLTTHSIRRQNLPHQKHLDRRNTKNDSFQSESSSLSKEDLDMHDHYNNNLYIDDIDRDNEERGSIASSQDDLEDRDDHGRLTDDDEKEQLNGDEIGEDEDDTQQTLDQHTVPKVPSGTTAAMLWKSGACSCFSIEGEIVTGHGLIARDKSGTSDPYVKVKLSRKCVFKTKIVPRNLNPKWNEVFQLAVDDVNTDLVFKVYDFDRLSHDDDMGEARVNLANLEVSKENLLKLSLINRHGFEEGLGQIIVKLSIIPKTPTETIELSQAQLVNNTSKRVSKPSSKGQIWDSLLSVILVEGRNLKAMDSTGKSDPYVRFKLGADKYKSKSCKQTLSPVWHEQFDMKLWMAADNLPLLEMSVWDKDSGKDEFMGRTSLDLSTLKTEKSHYMELRLEDQLGVICLHVSITAFHGDECDSGIQSHEDTEIIRSMEGKFSVWKTAKVVNEIGWLQLKLSRAVGLAVADIGGASDPFAVIELGNQRLVTPTIYKTLNPQWDKTYEFPISDIHDVLEITVYDEDKRGAPEFLGRLEIPLLSVMSWEKRSYQLKDKRLQVAAKGHLILTLGVVYNPIRASIRSLNPKESKVLYEEPRFRRQLLQKNVDRITNLIRSIIATGEFVQSLFTWKFRFRSAFALTIYVLLVMNFECFMLPLILFLVLLKNYVVFMLSPNKHYLEEETTPDEDDDDDDDNDDKSKKGRSKTFREKLEAINKVCKQVQNGLDSIASFGERIKNTFNWTVPFLSYFLMVILLVGTVVLYMIPLRYLLLAWGVNKFTKRIRKPNAIPNNELLDFLSRVPSDPEVKKRRPLKTDAVTR